MIVNQFEKELFIFTSTRNLGTVRYAVTNLFMEGYVGGLLLKLLHKDNSSETLSVHSANHHTRPKDIGVNKCLQYKG